jgi:uncharacterized protein (TIGR03083 family)
MEIAGHIAIVAGEAKLLAAAARQGGLDADVTTCPGWDMRELLRHLIEIHLWAAAHVAQPHDKPWIDDREELVAFWPELAVFWPDDDALVDWYLASNANLVHALESAPLDVEAFTFLPAPSPLAMWARRQAHETAVHRFDGENAAGIPTEFDPTFAADGIDELVAGFAPRKQEFPVDRDKIMHIHAADTGDHWLMTLRPDGITTTRGDGPADVSLSGTAADLYLVLWNRKGNSSIDVTGDHELLEKWHGNTRVRWTN